MMMQSSVDWLVSKLPQRMLNYLKEEIEQAKAMERLEHSKTWDKALDTYEERGSVYVRAWEDFDDYYNETYGGNTQTGR